MDKHAIRGQRANMFAYVCVPFVFLFRLKKPVAKSFSASLCENGNWQDLQLPEEHIVDVF